MLLLRLLPRLLPLVATSSPRSPPAACSFLFQMPPAAMAAGPSSPFARLSFFLNERAFLSLSRSPPPSSDDPSPLPHVRTFVGYHCLRRSLRLCFSAFFASPPSLHSAAALLILRLQNALAGIQPPFFPHVLDATTHRPCVAHQWDSMAP